MSRWEVLDKYDQMSGVRKLIKDIASDKNEWCGLPMPLDDEQLVVEPSHPFAESLMNYEPREKPKYTIRNVFWSGRRRCDIYVIEDKGKITFGVVPKAHGLMLQVRTLGCSVAWGVEQEHNALMRLATLLRPHSFKQYLMTGSFLETSRRSRLMYLFRKLRPTVALSTYNDNIKIICGLCMHPIAYYDDSWAGAMCPTDDVIAHLMLMRGDEHMFWKRCSQHPAYRPESGL